MGDKPRSSTDWAEYLKQHWEIRSRSDQRDYYIAPQGYGDEESWNAQGAHLANAVLTGIDPDWLASQDILEIGCGVGRLARVFAPLGRSYTGLDIAPTMVADARERHTDDSDMRFFETDGLRIPDEARDREYGLIMVIAVLIHCAKSVVAANVSDAYSRLTPGGILRIQVFANPADPDGVIVAEVGEQGLENFKQEVAQTTPEQADLIDEYYMGHPFGYSELQSFLDEHARGAEVKLHREELTCIYASIEKPA